MIERIEFDERPMLPGAERTLRAWATSKLSVDINCFTQSPPPPGYKPCPSCGTIRINSGEAVRIVADRATFRRFSGYLQVTVRDLEGDEKIFQLTVREQEIGELS